MTENKLTAHVLQAYEQIENPRTKQLVKTLIQHLHSFVKETKLTQQEWEFTWDFCAKMAKFTSADRNEFLLFADVMGLSQLIEITNHPRSGDAVGYALVGPFYRAHAPVRQRGETIVSADTTGERVNVSGKVIDINTGVPLANAMLDIWQCATNGFYECQDPQQPEMNLRGKFFTDHQGTFAFQALMPTSYPVPTDGPVGDLLRLAKRHPYRPAHIHFIVSAANFETLVSQIFVPSDHLINSDVVFTANDSMLGNFSQKDGVNYLEINFQLTPGISTYPEAPIK